MISLRQVSIEQKYDALINIFLPMIKYDHSSNDEAASFPFYLRKTIFF